MTEQLAQTVNGFIKLNGVQTQAATPFDDFIENSLLNMKRGLKDLKEIPGLQVIKGHQNPVGLIGGGPSIKKEVENIKAFQKAGNPIVACGSSYDWLVLQDIIPDYCVICDPDPLTIEYAKLKHEKTVFLISYSCSPKVFDYFIGNKVYAWHCYTDEAHKKLLPIDPNYFGISGGCTVGLRSLNLFIMMGYTNHHLWGFDSCVSIDGKEHHAYEFATDKEELGPLFQIRIGSDKPEEDKTYTCVGYQLAQAHNFQDFYFSHHVLFTPTFHGEGMLTDFMSFIERQGVINELKMTAFAKMGDTRLNFTIGT